MLFLAVGGCKKQEWGAPVKGRVLLPDGSVLKAGAVTFIGPTGQAANCEIKDGTYEIATPPFGKCTIVIMTVPPPPPGDGVNPPPFGSKEWPKGDYVELHPDYADASRSGLSFEVTSKPQTHDIKLDRQP